MEKHFEVESQYSNSWNDSLLNKSVTQFLINKLVIKNE